MFNKEQEDYQYTESMYIESNTFQWTLYRYGDIFSRASLLAAMLGTFLRRHFDVEPRSNFHSVHVMPV